MYKKYDSGYTASLGLSQTGQPRLLRAASRQSGQHWRDGMFSFLALILLFFTFYCYKTSKWKYKNLPSPGLCLPVIGHSYKMMNKAVLQDLTNGIWDIYRKYQKNGILYINTLSLNCLWIGDFETLKYVFNLPEVQKRINENITKLALHNRYQISVSLKNTA